MRIYAHRGASLEFPENTLASFQRALDLGVDALELDVHQTLDGAIVVSHDESGLRMAGVDRKIRESSLAEVQRWNVGHGFEAGGDKFSIPTLDEVLESFPDAIINVDIKPANPSFAVTVGQTVCRKGAHERVQLASFHRCNLSAVRRSRYPGVTALAPMEIRAALLLPEWLFRRFAPPGARIQIPVSSGRWRLDSRERIEAFHRLGLRVDYWTINDPIIAGELAARGADGIMTDDPAGMIGALRPI